MGGVGRSLERKENRAKGEDRTVRNGTCFLARNQGIQKSKRKMEEYVSFRAHFC